MQMRALEVLAEVVEAMVFIMEVPVMVVDIPEELYIKAMEPGVLVGPGLHMPAVVEDPMRQDQISQ